MTRGKGAHMRKRIALSGIVLAGCLVVVAGIGSAYSSSIASTSRKVPRKVPMFDGAIAASSIPPTLSAITIPGARTTPMAASQDTTIGVDQSLRTGFSIESTPTDEASAVSRDQALATAKSACPDYAQQAQAVTIRHVAFTDSAIAKLSDSALADLGVTERPKDLNAWMVTFHKVALHWHGPDAGRPHPATDDFVVMISAKTGRVLEASGFGPVQ